MLAQQKAQNNDPVVYDKDEYKALFGDVEQHGFKTKENCIHKFWGAIKTELTLKK